MNPAIQILSDEHKSLLARMANGYQTTGGPYLDAANVAGLTDLAVRQTLWRAHEEREQGRLSDEGVARLGKLSEALNYDGAEPQPEPVAGFRYFTGTDWCAFAGAESEHPQIAELHETSVLIDGFYVSAYSWRDQECSAICWGRDCQNEYALQVAADIIEKGRAMNQEKFWSMLDAVLGKRGSC